MEEIELRDLETIFAQVEDPRVERTKLHRLRDIIILAICEMICGAEGRVEIEEFGKAKGNYSGGVAKLEVSFCYIRWPSSFHRLGLLDSYFPKQLRATLAS